MSKIVAEFKLYNSYSDISLTEYKAKVVEKLNDMGIPAYDAGDTLAVHTGVLVCAPDYTADIITVTWADGEDADAITNKAD